MYIFTCVHLCHGANNSINQSTPPNNQSAYSIEIIFFYKTYLLLDYLLLVVVEDVLDLYISADHNK